MARSYDGELWTWGKGLRGQLGQGKTKFSLIPRKVDSFTSFLQIDSGFGHSDVFEHVQEGISRGSS